MLVVFGGAYQGKLDYVLNGFSKTQEDVYECNENSLTLDLSKKVINKLHLFVLANIKNGSDPVKLLTDLLPQLTDKIIICDDISSGVVPLDAVSRMWRESTGYALTLLVRNSSEVVRIFCGLELKLKENDK